MLHVFAVNVGRMMTYDVALAMERVIDLKKTVANSNEIGPYNKQVMLINGGQSLDDNAKVCSYAAGTETNPIYLFDVSIIEKNINQQITKLQDYNGFSAEIRSSLLLPPCCTTVVARTQLALKMHEASRHQVHTIKSLVNDEHIMFQGWQAAVANLSEQHFRFEQRLLAMQEQCSITFQESQKYKQILEGLEEVLTTLGHIPVMPVLLLNSQSLTAPQLTLRSWIEAKCRDTDLGDLLVECKERLAQLTEDKLRRLLQESRDSSQKANSEKMKNITGIVDRLSALDNVIIAATEQVEEQKGIAQGFMKNLETARELQDCDMNRDALLTLCESHVTQLQIMHDNEAATREAMLKCYSAKEDLAKALHFRLRWLYFVQRTISNADAKLSMFYGQLAQMRHQLEFLSQVKRAPEVYFSLVNECIRRKSFSQMFTQWTDGVLTASRISRDREIVRRKKFKLDMGNHFLQKLFPGFADKPPLIAKRPLRKFDLELPNIPNDAIQLLTESFPQFKQPEIEVDALPDPSQLSWQLVYSTSTKTAMMLESSETVVTSQNVSVTSSINSASMIEESVNKPDEPLYTSVKPATNFSPGGFVTTSVKDMLLSEVTQNQTSKDLSPRDLMTPPPNGVLECGSPESGEFFSIQPFEASSPPKLQPRKTISLARRDNFTSDMFPIPEDKVPDANQEGTLLVKMATPSLLASSNISDEDEMFHSFTNEIEKEKVSAKFKEIEKAELEEDMQRIKRTYEEEIVKLQENHEEIVSNYDRRLAESRAELQNIIGQLEGERKKRKVAWEKESRITNQLDDLKAKYAAMLEENANLKTELNEKFQLLSNFDRESKSHKNALEIESASVREQAEREMWKLKEEFVLKGGDFQKNIETLEKDLKLKNSELNAAEDRIQELETQLSSTEAKFHTVEASIQEYEEDNTLCHKTVNEQKRAKVDAELAKERAENQLAQALVEISKSEETSQRLKAMLAAYEVELENVRERNNILKKHQDDLNEERQKNQILQTQLASSTKLCQELEVDLAACKRLLANYEKTIAEHESTLEEKLNVNKENFTMKLKLLEQETEDRIKKTMASNEQNIELIKTDHVNEICRLVDEHQTEMEKLTKANRLELDEMQADRLLAVVFEQRKRDQLQEQYNELQDQHKVIEENKMNVLADKERLEKELEKAWRENSDLQAKLTKININPLLHESVDMLSSNEERDLKRTKMSDKMMTSYKAEVEKEMKTSFKKREEDATKRRQMVFNSAIQRVTMAKDAEIEKLKNLLLKQGSSITSSIAGADTDVSQASSTRSKEKIKVVMNNFQRDDLVLVMYDARYGHYIIFALSNTLHFVHSETTNELSLKKPDTRQENITWMLAKFLEKEYCEAKKAANRFNVSEGTRFYRVKLAAYNKTGS